MKFRAGCGPANQKKGDMRLNEPFKKTCKQLSSMRSVVPAACVRGVAALNEEPN